MASSRDADRCGAGNVSLRLGTVVVLALTTVSSARLSPVKSKPASGPVVMTASGPVRGEIEKGVIVFRGIRFAAPPEGDLRFRPPVPPIPWTEERPAVDFAPA